MVPIFCNKSSLLRNKVTSILVWSLLDHAVENANLIINSQVFKKENDVNMKYKIINGQNNH